MEAKQVDLEENTLNSLSSWLVLKNYLHTNRYRDKSTCCYCQCSAALINCVSVNKQLKYHKGRFVSHLKSCCSSFLFLSFLTASFYVSLSFFVILLALKDLVTSISSFGGSSYFIYRQYFIT